LEPADFLAESLRWAAGVVRGDIVVHRTEVSPDEAVWKAAVERGRAAVDQRYHGAAPAPVRALDLVEAARTATRDEGFAAEDEALADLVMGDELRAGLYAFDLVQKRAKRPAGAPDRGLARPVTKVGVVGAGLMAGQLALLFARRLGVPVVMTDIDDERLRAGVERVHTEIAGLLGKGRISRDDAHRLTALVTGSTDLTGFADADFVIEAVFEDLAIKQKVFAELEAVVTSDCVLATNTSSLSVTAMASGLAHPERVVGFHFFNPVAILPLLEVVRGAQTDDAALATAFAVGKQLKKSCVLVTDAPAFVVNRLLTRFLGAVTAAADSGTPAEVADHALDPLGLPMSPFNLLALVGPAVALHVAETMHQAYPDRFAVSPGLQRMVEAGKTAVYDWSSGSPVVDPDVAACFLGDTPMTAAQVRDAAESALAEEIAIMLEEGVVDDVRDIDMCLLLGAGWPFHLGGITPYLDRVGVSERITGHRFLSSGIASVG
jgi:3-hydroxyacyl-CoA dehydrogenase